jgi:hypothetical protein
LPLFCAVLSLYLEKKSENLSVKPLPTLLILKVKNLRPGQFTGLSEWPSASFSLGTKLSFSVFFQRYHVFPGADVKANLSPWQRTPHSKLLPSEWWVQTAISITWFRRHLRLPYRAPCQCQELLC